MTKTSNSLGINSKTRRKWLEGIYKVMKRTNSKLWSIRTRNLWK